MKTVGSRAGKPFAELVKRELRELLEGIKGKSVQRVRQAAEELARTVRALVQLGRIDPDILSKIVRSPEDARNLVRYVDEGGEETLRHINVVDEFSRTGLRLVENNPEHGLLHIWNEHIDEWGQLGINSPEQLKLVIQDVIRTGRGGIRRYVHRGTEESQLWFYDQTRNTYVAIRQNEGVWEIWTAFRPEEKWDYIAKAKWMFEIK